MKGGLLSAIEASQSQFSIADLKSKSGRLTKVKVDPSIHDLSSPVCCGQLGDSKILNPQWDPG